MLTDAQLDTLRDFRKFAPKFLSIRAKSGEKRLFVFNRAQDYLHARLQAQKEKTGKVRAIILKGRQQGCSTYIQARFFHQVITSRGKKAFILTHDKEATKNLFSMAQRFYENLDANLVPKPDTANAKELYFREFDSGYAVGTAGNKSVGRSQTIQLMHACLAEGTLIYDPMTGGLKKIENFLIDDTILTHTGEKARVSYISNQEKECTSVKFRTLTTFPLVATKEHKVWTKNGWHSLGDLKINDSIGYPVRKIERKYDVVRLPEATVRKHGGGRQFKCPDTIDLDYNFGRIIGLYLAEGFLKLQHKDMKLPCAVIFVIHRKETERTIKWLLPFKEYFSSFKVKDRKNCMTTEISVYGNRFSGLINEICGRTKDKRVPVGWYGTVEDFCRGMLHGYLSGDGGSYENSRRISAPSILNSITVSMRDICASLGYGWASILYRKGEIRHGRNEKDQYTFSLCGEGARILAEEIGKPSLKRKRKVITKTHNSYSAATTEISDGYAWLRIRDIENVGIKKVYDFEVNHEDHSYCTVQGAVSNSEVAYWAFAEDHSKGILQAISNEPGTEILMESTANGIGNYFHQRWLSGMSADSEYQAIFLPWYWQDEYTYNADNIHFTEEEDNLYRLYSQNGLTKEHIAWRRLKIGEFSKDYDAGREHFNVEYPMNATEAFKNPISNVFINSKYVEKARKADVEAQGSLIIGVDVAISDRDRTAIIRRRGRNAFNLERFQNYNTMEICGRLKRIIQEEKPKKMYVDCIGIGAGIVDRMQEMGFNCVEGINVARSANDKEKFKNLRAELWSDMRDWFYSEMPVQVPDSDELHGELCSLGFKENSSGQLQIESKDELRARGLPSPDGADALSLSFFGGCYGDGGGHIDVPSLSPWERGMFR